MINNKKEKHISKVTVFLSYFFPVISGMVVGFVVPKILGITGYGYYKIFNLYTGYVNIFSLGFVSGIYLKYGGQDLGNFDKGKFRALFKFYFILELSFCLIGFILTFYFFQKDKDELFIFLMVFVYLLFYNLFYYFDIITTICQKYKIMIERNIANSFLSIVIVVMIFLLRNMNIHLYELYIVLFIFIYFLLLLWYIFLYRDITLGEAYSLHSIKNEIVDLIKTGFPLMLADLVSSLIFLADRQVVSIFFDIDTYSAYSFAYTIFRVFITVLYSVSALLYPYLKRIKKDESLLLYSNITKSILIVSCFCIVSYYPVTYLVNCFFPEYSYSIVIYKYVILSLPFNCIIDLVVYNYYKIFLFQKNYFIKSLIILIIGIILDVACYYIFKDCISIVLSSLFVYIVWYIITDWKFILLTKYKFFMNYIYISLLIVIYLLANKYFSLIISFGIFTTAYIILTTSFYFSFIKHIIHRFFHKLRH